MDRKSSVREIIVLSLAGGLLIMCLRISCLLADAAPSEAPPDPSAIELPDTSYERIDMEEMNIQGITDKPSILYVIPRARIEIEMKLNDDYFLLSSADPNVSVIWHDPEFQAVERKKASLDEPLPSPPSSSFFITQKPEIIAGSCVSCHYPGMDIPKGSSTPLLLQELNQRCFQCHPARYYHICWKEVEKMAFESPDQGKNSCQKCHTPWTQPPGTRTRDRRSKESQLKWQWNQWAQPKENSWQRTRTYWQWAQPKESWQPREKQNTTEELPEQKYDIDTFCITCHKHDKR